MSLSAQSRNVLLRTFWGIRPPHFLVSVPIPLPRVSSPDRYLIRWTRKPMAFRLYSEQSPLKQYRIITAHYSSVFIPQDVPRFQFSRGSTGIRAVPIGTRKLRVLTGETAPVRKLVVPPSRGDSDRARFLHKLAPADDVLPPALALTYTCLRKFLWFQKGIIMSKNDLTI
jgi:hypothetical protein